MCDANVYDAVKKVNLLFPITLPLFENILSDSHMQDILIGPQKKAMRTNFLEMDICTACGREVIGAHFCYIFRPPLIV